MRIPRLAALVGAMLYCIAAAAAQNRPNVLLVLADDLGVDQLACYGATNVAPTPTIDALANGGMRFTRAYTNPACSPTRAAMLTGRYAFRTGVTGTLPFGAPGIDPGEMQLPTPLAAAGYACALIGKWHIGTRYGNWTPNLLGWPHFSGNLEAGLLDYYNWPKITDGAQTVVHRYATSDQVDEALTWVQGQTGPWVLVLSFFAPHSPVQAPPIDLHTQNLAGLDPVATPLPFHRAMIEAMDHELGRLLSGLGTARLANTNIVFAGDNGTDNFAIRPPTPQSHGKGSLFDGGSHVPLIVKGPAVATPGTVSNAFVSAVDVFPTVLEMAGSTFPQGFDQTRPLDGRSFKPILAGTRTSIRDQVFVEIAGTPLGEGYAARDAQYLLIRYTRTAPEHEELYDLTADPAESVDLMLQPLSPAANTAYQRLATALAAIRTEGWATLYGNGCSGSLGVPALRSQTPPTLGTTYFTFTGNVPASAPWLATMIGGSDRFAEGGVPLPVALGSLGMPGCSLLVSLEGTIQIATTGYGGIRLPSIVSLQGTHIYLQTFVAEPSANAAGLITSRGLRCTIGRL